jgi:hypothetical protein
MTGTTVRGLEFFPSTTSSSQAFPIGSCFIGFVATNPATLLGYGTWTLASVGRFMVGIDPSDTNFATLGQTGGESAHTLTDPETPDTP